MYRGQTCPATSLLSITRIEKVDAKPSTSPTIAKMQASRQRIGRQLLQESKRRTVGEGYRCFSCSVRQAQQQTPPPKTPRDGNQTTHFGFETIAEALKEQRGTRYCLSIRTLNG
jgi:hypothetical protein